MDPAFAYELATIIRHGIEEMYAEKDVLHYIAIYNENYPMPPKPKGVDEGIIKGMYLLLGAPKVTGPWSASSVLAPSWSGSGCR